MVIASKVHALRLLHNLGEVKPGIDKAFAGSQGDWEANWATGVYKSRSKGSVSLPGPASSCSPGAALETIEDGLPIQTKSEAVGLGLGDYKDSIAKSITLAKNATEKEKYEQSIIRPSCIDAIAFDCEGKRLGEAMCQERRNISIDVGSPCNSDGTEKTRCGAWAIVAECESGEHHFAKRILCGQEWCEVCGADNSASHKRRQARILPRIQQVKELGYFVIEWPDWARHIGEKGINPDSDQGQEVAGWCYSKAQLRSTTKAIIEVMAGRHGRNGRTDGYFSRGIGRWHWFGDQIPGKWNPHFNLLVDSAYLEKPLLEKIKASLRAALNCPDLIVHYSYFNKPGQLVQKVRYVTRATFRDYSWNPYMARELFKFRNVRWWGNWKGEPAWDLRQAEVEGEDVAGLHAVSKLQEGLCPDCGRPLRVLYHDHKTGKPVRWSRPVDSIYLDIWGSQEIAGSGYYRIPHREWFGYSFSPGELLRLQELEARARQNPSVHPWAVAMRQSVDDLWRATRTYKCMYRRKVLGDSEKLDR